MLLFDLEGTRSFFDLREDVSRIDWFEEALSWASQNYPDSEWSDRESFASLVELFVTGRTRDTDEDPKRERIKSLVMSLFGAHPRAPGAGVRPSAVLSWTEWTRAALRIMAVAFFVHSPVEALSWSVGIVGLVPGDSPEAALMKEGMRRVVEHYFLFRALAAMRRVLPLRCLVCGKDTRGTARRKYCSSACRQRAMRMRAKARLP